MSPTRHDPSKVVMGVVGSSDRELTMEDGDPATYPAGLALRRTSAGGVSPVSSAGAFIGVSMGASLSDTKKLSVCRVGDRVPVRLKDEGAYSTLVVGDLTFSSVTKDDANDSITIALLDTADAGEEVVTVDGLDIEIAIESGVSTAQQIYDAIQASAEALALISVEIADGEESTAQTAAASDNLAGGADSYPYVVKGVAVKFDNTTGEAASSGTTSAAVYISGPLTGVDLGGTEVGAAQVDMPGGL